MTQYEKDYQKYEQELERRAKAEQLSEQLANTLYVDSNQSGDDKQTEAEKEDYERRLAAVKVLSSFCFSVYSSRRSKIQSLNKAY